MKKLLLMILISLSFASHAQLAVEGFEGPWPPAGWNVYNVAGSLIGWDQSNNSTAQPAYQGNFAAFIDNESQTSPGFINDWLVTPETVVAANAQVRFFSRLTLPGNQSTLYKLMLLPQGGNAANLSEYILLEQWTEEQINPVQLQYTEKVVAVPSAYTGSVVRFAFIMQGSNGDRWLIDNVLVTGECPAPAYLTATNIEMTSATLSWTETGDATQWEFEIMPENAAPTGVGMVTTESPFVITGIMPGQCYKYYVRSVCGADVESAWAGPFNFCTLGCSPSEQCNYTFYLSDLGLNGWEENTMSVIQNGITIATLELQSTSQAVSLPLCNDVPWQLVWNGGGTNPQQVGVIVANANQQTIYNSSQGSGLGEPGTILFSGVGQCTADFCYPPENIELSATGTVITATWTGADGFYEYYAIHQGDPAPTSTTLGVGVSGTTAYIPGLTNNTYYDVYVRAVCPSFNGAMIPSAWAGPVSINTGTGNNVSGTVYVDTTNDGVCNQQDIGLPSMEIIATVDGGTPFSVYTNQAGQYLIQDLTNSATSLTLVPVAPAGFDEMDPVTLALDFTQAGYTGVDFCAPVPVNTPSDIAVYLIPYMPAQPGFNTSYTVQVINNSLLTANDVIVNVTFDNSRISLSSVNLPHTVSGNTITIQLGDMEPLGNAYAYAVFNVLAPPVNVGGEVLVYTTEVSMTDADGNVTNNIHTLNHVIVNSYDPNDITVHEGAEIYEDQTDDYLTYTIRFQNTGTANAINIRLENTFDELLDWDTFMPVTSSHNYNVTRTGNQLKFVYNNIQLPDSTANEAASHGYVTYRIKPKSTFGLGDIVSNTAEIYFDFNPAIVTNTATTEVVATMALGGNSRNNITLYPNPVQDKLYIAATDDVVLSVKLSDLNGREIEAALTGNFVDTSHMSAGIYIAAVTTSAGTTTHRIIKQ